MIPHPMLSNEIFGNGLKDRVTACRKRLRLKRIQRAQTDVQLEELFRETALGASEFKGYSGADAGVRETFVEGVDGQEGIHRPDGKTSRVDEQEVGIT